MEMMEKRENVPLARTSGGRNESLRSEMARRSKGFVEGVRKGMRELRYVGE